MLLDLEQAKTAIRLILRECFWAELAAVNSNITVQFGYDYYAYMVGVKVNEGTVNWYADKGIFIEKIDW